MTFPMLVASVAVIAMVLIGLSVLAFRNLHGWSARIAGIGLMGLAAYVVAVGVVIAIN